MFRYTCTCCHTKCTDTWLLASHTASNRHVRDAIRARHICTKLSARCQCSDCDSIKCPLWPRTRWSSPRRSRWFSRTQWISCFRRGPATTYALPQYSQCIRIQCERFADGADSQFPDGFPSAPDWPAGLVRYLRLACNVDRSVYKNKTN